jgi:hypothetical protein
VERPTIMMSIVPKNSERYSATPGMVSSLYRPGCAPGLRTTVSVSDTRFFPDFVAVVCTLDVDPSNVGQAAGSREAGGW